MANPNKSILKLFGLTFPVFLFFSLMAVTTKARQVVDQTGVRVEIAGEPRRLISLAPSLTEMIFSLRAENRLVGVTRYSNYPAAAKKIPRVGSYVQLDLERIIAMEPDLCLAIKDGNPRRTVEAIKSFSIPVFAIDPRSIEEIMIAYRLLGDILGTAQRADELVTDMQSRLASVAAKVASRRTRPRVFFQIADNPMVSAGKDSYIDKLISLAGGMNLAGAYMAYPRFSWEDIMVLQPEVVLLSSMDGEKSPANLKAAWQRWPGIPAVANHQLHIVDADLFNRPTERLVDGLEILADLLGSAGQGEEGEK